LIIIKKIYKPKALIFAYDACSDFIGGGFTNCSEGLIGSKLNSVRYVEQEH